MSEKLLVTQALDERDLLVKKINDKIAKVSFVDVVLNNRDELLNAHTTKDEFCEAVKSAYQQIKDLVTRFKNIDAAIVASNANTKIKTSYGEFTVAAAISLRNRLRENGPYGDGADFEGEILKKMRNDYRRQVQAIDSMNSALQRSAESMRLSILGKDGKVKDDHPLDVVDAYVRENTAVLVDPLNVMWCADSIEDRRNTLLRELDTQIKVSNATTYIEF
jgi:hypothetical protein